MKREISKKSVTEGFYGATDPVTAAGMEKLALPQAADPQRSAAGGQNVDSQGIRQTLL